MNVKRIVSALFGMPLMILILVLNNIYVLDVVFTGVSLVCLHEFYKAFSEKYNPAKWIGYLSTLVILGLNLFVENSLFNVLILMIFISFLLSFLEVFRKKINIIDAGITLLGIFYITIFMLFIPLTQTIKNGNLLIWYIFVSAWATDVFAYFIGRYLGKHKLTAISPKKTIEGSIGGIIGSVIGVLIATFVFNTYFDMNYSYIFMSIIAIVLSVISQIGDLVASSIKRFCEIKDFSNLIPGHGGMLDRFDSVIFIAPIAYLLIAMI